MIGVMIFPLSCLWDGDKGGSMKRNREEVNTGSYYDDLEVDSYNLLEEWQAQPGLYLSYAETSTEVQEEVDNLKDRLDVLQAQTELSIRTGEYALAPEGMKVTDKAILALVITDPQVIALKKEYNHAKKDATLMKKVEIAFDQRKKGLENAVVLTGREQYATPRDRTDGIKDSKESRQQKTNDAIEAKLNKTKQKN